MSALAQQAGCVEVSYLGAGETGDIVCGWRGACPGSIIVGHGFLAATWRASSGAQPGASASARGSAELGLSGGDGQRQGDRLHPRGMPGAKFHPINGVAIMMPTGEPPGPGAASSLLRCVFFLPYSMFGWLYTTLCERCFGFKAPTAQAVSRCPQNPQAPGQAPEGKANLLLRVNILKGFRDILLYGSPPDIHTAVLQAVLPG